MKGLQSIEAFALFAAYLALGFSAFKLFAWGYTYITPYDETSDAKSNRWASTIALAGAMLGFLFPLLSAMHHGASILDTALWAAIAAILQIAWLMAAYHWWLAQINTSPNEVIATRMATTSIALGLIQAFAMIP
jgi:putative membrane protein